MRVLFSGGGTAGPVTPLLAVATKIQEHATDQSDLLWLGTFHGPEKKLVTSSSIPFTPIFSGKLRRYLHWRNFVDPFLVLFGFFQALVLLYRFKPDVVVSAGAFVSVPVAWAAWFLRIPVIIHQLDIRKGLANALMSPVATVITVSFEEVMSAFPEKKTVYIGTPIRETILQGDKDRARSAFNLDPALPTIVVLGGGTGSLFLNKLIVASLPELLHFSQVIHITGSGKSVPTIALKERAERYHAFEFVIDELPNIFAAADVVVSRAGIGTLTELAALGKATMVIPIPDSQQEENAAYFAKRNAIVPLKQKDLSGQSFVEEMKSLLADTDSIRYLEVQIQKLHRREAAAHLQEIIQSFATEDQHEQD